MCWRERERERERERARASVCFLCQSGCVRVSVAGKLEQMFNNTPTRKLHLLLGVKQHIPKEIWHVSLASLSNSLTSYNRK